MQRLLMVRIVRNGDLTSLAPQDNNLRTQIACLEPAGGVKSSESNNERRKNKRKMSLMDSPSNFPKQLL